VTQLTTFVPSISCNITLKMAVIAAKHVGKNTATKSIINIEVHLLVIYILWITT